ncbi:MAG: hypothetical protein QW620_06270 [Thermoplasmata archaeon]
MPGKDFYEFSNLADPRMQEAIFCIFERPCIRVRTLAKLCQMPKSSLHRKLGNLEYLVVLPNGGVVIKEMAVDVPLFSVLERESYYKVILACKKPMSIERLESLTGRNKNSLYGTLSKLIELGILEKKENYLLSQGLQERYTKLLATLPASLALLERILTEEKIEHKVVSKAEKTFVECFGRKRTLMPYERLQAIL